MASSFIEKLEMANSISLRVLAKEFSNSKASGLLAGEMNRRFS
jgi:hypothetical protein